MQAGIFIDDTGSPGCITPSKYLLEDRKTWIALFFDSYERKEAENELKGCIKYLQEEFGVNEFHFTDIYSGTKRFKDVHADIRLGVFKAFAEIFRLYKWPVMVQTIHSKSLLEHGLNVSGGTHTVLKKGSSTSNIWSYLLIKAFFCDFLYVVIMLSD